MTLRLKGFTPELIAAMKPKDGGATIEWDRWAAAVTALREKEFRFLTLERTRVWTARYATSPKGGHLELILDGISPEWRLFADAPAEKGPLRALLTRPVARMAVRPGAMAALVDGGGEWELCLPVRHAFEATITGAGAKVETWEARIGLQGKHAGSLRWSHVDVSIPEDAKQHLDADISGRYKLLDKCGGARSALHKRVAALGGAEDDGSSGGGGAAEPAAPPLFLFQDPTRCGDPEDDSFVFAREHRRLAFNEQRVHIAVLDEGW
ncbi:hypothetical protein JKP88DRAFT_294934, partial [Tribonema minus]